VLALLHEREHDKADAQMHEWDSSYPLFSTYTGTRCTADQTHLTMLLSLPTSFAFHMMRSSVLRLSAIRARTSGMFAKSLSMRREGRTIAVEYVRAHRVARVVMQPTFRG
jgi:hypothetical protein